MGIQGLARRLEPYATRYSPDQLEGYSAVIDGPALSYYAHKLALAASSSPTRIPSYADIIKEAIRWLNSLEYINIKVSIILFDGALPQSKRAERLSRLEQNNRRVQQLRASYATAACPIPTYLGSNSYAFLAPALKEALLESSFASRTRVVPGEADDWCALHAKDNARSLVLTSDSDLILYDYPPETLIVFLHDADLVAGMRSYSPEQIRHKLQLKSLIPFAYAIRQGPQDTANDLISNAQKVDLDSDEYADFSRRYTAENTARSHISNTSAPLLTLSQTDVRVSEFVHQALGGSLTSLVYLPLLVEDPNHASAWIMGEDIRILAYSLLVPEGLIVQEYRRKAQGIAVQEISPYSASNVQVPATELERHISGLKAWAESKVVGPELLWLLFALSLVLADLNSPPAIALVLRVLNGEFDNTWTFIQLAARLQAVVYSLRMLDQIIKVWLATDEKGNIKLHECLSSLNKHMDKFPSIAGTFSVPGQKARTLAEHGELNGLVEEIYASAGMKVPTEQVSNKKKKRLMREAERKKRKAEQRQQPMPHVSNTFLLPSDGRI